MVLQLSVFGVILAWLYERTGSIRPTIAVHMLNNAIAFAVLRVDRRHRGVLPQSRADEASPPVDRSGGSSAALALSASRCRPGRRLAAATPTATAAQPPATPGAADEGGAR